MWKWPFQAGCKCCSHVSIKKSPDPRHISVLESCKTHLAPLPSWMWLRGSGLPLVLWPEYSGWESCSPAALHLSRYRHVWEMHALLPGPGSRRTGKMTTEVAGCRSWGRHLAGSRLFLSLCWTYKYFWGYAPTSPKFRVHWAMWDWEK